MTRMTKTVVGPESDGGAVDRHPASAVRQPDRSYSRPPVLGPGSALHLQRSIGNRAFSSLLTVQRGKKRQIDDEADDESEQREQKRPKAKGSKEGTPQERKKTDKPKRKKKDKPERKKYGYRGKTGNLGTNPARQDPSRALVNAVSEEGWVLYNNVSQAGRWSPQVGVRVKRDKSEDRVGQILSHLSTVAYSWITEQEKPVIGEAKKEKKAHDLRKKTAEEKGESFDEKPVIVPVGEQEVQAMYANGRLLISANQQGSIETLSKIGPGELQQLLMAGNIPSKGDRDQKSAKKLSGALNEKREGIDFKGADAEQQRTDWGNIVAALKNLATGATSFLVADGPKKAAEMLADDKLIGTVILVMPSTSDIHAEQHLIMTLSQYRADQGGAATKDPAYIFGKKRPCFGCYMTFQFAQERLNITGMQFNDRPGGAWQTSFEGVDQIVAQHAVTVAALGLDAKQFEAWVRTKMTGTVTHLTAGPEEENKTHYKVPSDLRPKGVDSEHLTESESEYEEKPRKVLQGEKGTGFSSVEDMKLELGSVVINDDKNAELASAEDMILSDGGTKSSDAEMKDEDEDEDMARA